MVADKKKKFDLESLIDRIPSDTVNLTGLANFCDTQLRGIMTARKEFIQRRESYLPALENFVDYDTGPEAFEGASHLHVPLILEKVRATHSKLLGALLSGFMVEPQERLDVSRLFKISQLMKWATSRFVNNYNGVDEVLDDAVWSFANDGWCVLHLRWDRKVRKALVVEEKPVKSLSKDETDQLDIKYKLREKEEWVDVYNGPVLDWVPVEKVFMPGYGDLQTAPLVGIEMNMSAHELRYFQGTTFFISDAVNKALKFPNQPNSFWGDYCGIERAQSEAQGVDSRTPGALPHDITGGSTDHTVILCYATVDANGDGFDEELVLYYHPLSNTILRWTYLDRITKTGRRPLYKADYIRRPGRPYPIGLSELLFPINTEVDAMHNQRVDYGTITNMPFFFYNSLSTLPNEKIKIMPGQGTPVMDTSGILFPQMRNSTAWGFQEEAGLYQMANRVSAISDLNVGQPNSAEMLRTQGGVAALLGEGNSVLDVSLKRLQRMYGLVLSDMHQMLVERLPRQFQHVVIGDDGAPVYDTIKGVPFLAEYTNIRKEIAGRVHFHIHANTTTSNKAVQRTTRLQIAQQLVNPIALQMGIVNPMNVYNSFKRLLEAYEELNIDELITKPENAAKPLHLAEEIDMIKQGLFPEIPYNDSHQEKAQALQMWIQSPQVQEGLRQGNVHQLAPIITMMVINEHTAKQQMIQAQQQYLQNTQGAQVSQSVGSNRGPMGPMGGNSALPAQALLNSGQQGQGPMMQQQGGE